MYYVKPERKKMKLAPRLLSAVLAISVIIILFNSLLEYMIHDTAVVLSKNAASRAVNDAVISVLDDKGYVYTDFIEIASDENGAVQSVSAKSESVNRFKSEVSKAVIEALESKENAEFSIPLGTLTDIGMLYGRGPDINIKLKFYGDITSSVYSTYVSMGINQTKHSIICVVSANITIITPGFTEKITVKGEYMIAETVIIGEIPDSYTNVNGDESGIIGQIFDYADIG